MPHSDAKHRFRNAMTMCAHSQVEAEKAGLARNAGERHALASEVALVQAFAIVGEAIIDMNELMRRQDEERKEALRLKTYE